MATTPTSANPTLSVGKSTNMLNVVIGGLADTSTNRFECNVPSKFRINTPSSTVVSDNRPINVSNTSQSVGIGTEPSDANDLFNCNWPSQWLIGSTLGDKLGDYVVEKGSSGNWTWIKYASGFKVAWFQTSTTTNQTLTNWASSSRLYYKEISVGDFPSGIGFTEVPMAIGVSTNELTGGLSVGNTASSATSNAITTTNGGLANVYRPANSASPYSISVCYFGY